MCPHRLKKKIKKKSPSAAQCLKSVCYWECTLLQGADYLMLLSCVNRTFLFNPNTRHYKELKTLSAGRDKLLNIYAASNPRLLKFTCKNLRTNGNFLSIFILSLNFHSFSHTISFVRSWLHIDISSFCSHSSFI